MRLPCFVVPFFLPMYYDHYLLGQEVKEKLLQESIDKNRIILLGGSNVAFGFNSQLLDDSLQYYPINMGLNAGIGTKLALDVCADYIHHGDILVISPEYEQFFHEMGSPYGHKDMGTIFYLHPTRYAKYMNEQQWKILVENFPICAKVRIVMFAKQILSKFDIEKETVYRKSSLNKYGDVVKHWDKKKTYHQYSRSQLYMNEPVKEFEDYFIKKVKAIQSMGVQVIVYPSVVSESQYNGSVLNLHYIDSILKVNDIPFVCDYLELVYPDSLFYDTHLHLHQAGAEKRTLHLIKYLR